MREIGRVVVNFSQLEYILSQVLYVILQIDRQTGRLAIVEPRATERLRIIWELAQQRGWEINLDFDAMYAMLEKIQKDRNQIVHGNWIFDPIKREFLVSVTTGSYVHPGKTGSLKRRIEPQALPINLVSCRNITEGIKQARALTIQLLEIILEMQPLSPSLQTPQGRSHPLGRFASQVPSEPPPPPQPLRRSPEGKAKHVKLSSAQKRAARLAKQGGS
jgi:hypothetical protein